MVFRDSLPEVESDHIPTILQIECGMGVEEAEEAEEVRRALSLPVDALLSADGRPFALGSLVGNVQEILP